MSATRDKTQKFTFVYSNLYQIYKQGKEAAIKADLPPFVHNRSSEVSKSTRVLKTGDLNQNPSVAPKVNRYEPVEFLKVPAKPIRVPNPVIPKPEVIAPVTPEADKIQNQAIESLKQNLQQLDDLHSRLQFMLKELEDLVKE
jgi:hypothetical protein